MPPAQSAIASPFNHIADQGLKVILGNARVFQMAVKNNVVPIANHQHAYIWLAPCAELIDARERVFDTANVHNEKAWRRLRGERCGCGFDRTFRVLGVINAEIAERLTDDSLGVLIGHKNFRGRCRCAGGLLGAMTVEAKGAL
jgi:hypothetical protein